MPRDVDPAVRDVKGVFLYDLDDLENVTDPNADEREAAAVEAQKILQDEAQGFRRKLMAERVVPTIVALRLRLDEICATRTGCLSTRERALLQGPGRNAECNHVPDDAEDRRIPGP